MMIIMVKKQADGAPNFQHKNGLQEIFVSLSSPCAALEYTEEYTPEKCFQPT